MSDLEFSGITRWWAGKEKKSNKFKICLDVTKEKHALFLEANNLVKGNNDVKFCFVDINCRLKIKWKDEFRPDSFFTSLNDLKEK